ncbi:hypothetical protein OM076_01660 [Solirubrobacter ginsenosidimutans]|uniref:Uncharacterized protein n=1 Tax=Solirubrobacter ginsenosidimutans TaxID=490573 RepID=A0A9X3RXV2_9ACTN|nr:hypothetical protein [Solirubrobacter ginsenosidimutans]MDA0158955.1 hypothetical protein [Solirubrobacter ginsenosidimutans]
MEHPSAPSPARNRVTPLGDIEAFELRGAFTGNRGILHDGVEVVRFHAHDAWITCALRFKDRWSEQWRPHRFTWLYFYDEAVSFAAGHRPCAECRRRSYKDYQSAWAQATGRPASAKAMNKQLHAERLVRGTHRRRLHSLPIGDLPDGVFVMLDDAPHVLVGDTAVEWTRDGYSARRRRPAHGVVTTITPPSTIDVLRCGYAAQIHPSAVDPA